MPEHIAAGDLSDLTVVFLTKNREQFLRNNVYRYSSSGAKIVILDGSSYQPTKLLSSTKDLTIFHIWQEGPPESRFHLAKKFIKTRYVVLSADDDFHLLSSLDESVKFLNMNQDYISCNGGVIHYGYENGQMRFSNSHQELDLYRSREYSSKKLLRVLKYISRYDGRYIYSVTRSEFWIDVFCNSRSRKSLGRNYLELIFELGLCLHGKCKLQSRVNTVRNMNEPAHRNLEKENYRIFPSFGQFNTITNYIFSLPIRNIKFFDYGFFRRVAILFLLIISDMLLLVSLIFKILSSKSQRVRVMKTEVVRNSHKDNDLEIILKEKNVYDTVSEIEQEALKMIKHLC